MGCACGLGGPASELVQAQAQNIAEHRSPREPEVLDLAALQPRNERRIDACCFSQSTHSHSLTTSRRKDLRAVVGRASLGHDLTYLLTNKAQETLRSSPEIWARSWLAFGRELQIRH